MPFSPVPFSAAPWPSFTSSCASPISSSLGSSPRGALGASRGLSETTAGVDVEVSFLVTGSAAVSALSPIVISGSGLISLETLLDRSVAYSQLLDLLPGQSYPLVNSPLAAEVAREWNYCPAWHLRCLSRNVANRRPCFKYL